MLKIVLIRPGSTEFDEQGRIQGTLDIPLSKQGREEVGRIIEPLRQERLEIVYAAPCASAQETAQAIADALELKCKTLDKLKNVNHGLWQGMLIDDVKTKQPRVYRQWQESPQNVCPPQGEMLETARERVQAVVSKLIRKYKQGAVGVVVPEPLASIMHSYLCDDTLCDLWKAREGGTWEVIPVTPEVLAAH